MWQRHRSAPVGASVAGAIALLATSAASVAFYVSVVRGARGLPAYTAGLPKALVAFPPRQRAVYDVQLAGPAERRTPGGTPSAAHRWRVDAGKPSGEPLCQGSADDELLARDASGTRFLVLPVPEALYAPTPPRPVPDRLVATCPALAVIPDPGALVYREWAVAPGTSVQVVACAFHADGLGALSPCDDGAPSRVYPVEGRAAARARARKAVLKIAAWAAALASACFAAGLLALRKFDGTRAAAP